MSACRVTLIPEDRGHGIERVIVRYELDGFGKKAGQTVMKTQLRTVGVPGAEPEDVQIADELGSLPLSVREEGLFSRPFHGMMAECADSGTCAHNLFAGNDHETASY